jgi:hypothetical protein
MHFKAKFPERYKKKVLKGKNEWTSYEIYLPCDTTHHTEINLGNRNHLHLKIFVE